MCRKTHPNFTPNCIIVSQQASVSGILEALSQCWSQEMQLGVKLG